MKVPRARVILDNQLLPIATEGQCPDTIWRKIRYFGRKACRVLKRSD